MSIVKFSVVIPLYNKVDSVSRTLASICEQRFAEDQCFASNYQKVFADADYRDPKLAIGDITPMGSVMNNYFEVCTKEDLTFMPSSLVISSQLFKPLGGFPVGEAMGEDQALFSQIALQANLVYSPLVLMLYHTDSKNRAYGRHIPQDVLPFAKRLLAKVAAGEVDKASAPFVLKYYAARICHLAKINIQAGQFSAIKQLLKHPVSKLKPLLRKLFGVWLVTKSFFCTMANLARVNCQAARTNSL